jgi:two-component system, NtrC family, sensor kinase
MQRRARASGGLTKGRRRKAAAPKRCHAPKAVPGSNSPPTQEEAEVARLTRELNDAREQQTATLEVLRVIGNSHGDVQPVFEAMLKDAVRVCDAKFGGIYRWDGDAFHLAATHNAPPAHIKPTA